MFENIVTVYYPMMNLPTAERWDLIYWVIGSAFGLALDRFYLEYQILLSFFGGCFLYKIIGLSTKEAVTRSMILLAAILMVVGFNPFYLKFGWLFFIIGTFIWTYNDPRWERVALGAIFLILFVFNAGALAPLGIIFSMLVVSLYCPKIFVFIIGNKIPLLYGAAASAFLLSILILPVYPLSEFPGDARLAPISPLMVRSYPLVGPYFEINPIVYSEYLKVLQSSLLLYLLGLSLFFILPFLGRGFIDRLRESKEGLILSAVFFIIAAGEFYQEWIPLSIQPYWLVWRLIPGIAVQESPTIVLVLGIVSFAIFGTNVKSIQHLTGLVVGISCLLYLNILCFNQLYLNKGYEVGKEEVGFWKKNFETGYVQKIYGDWTSRRGIQKERTDENLLRLINGKDFNISVSANRQNDKAPNTIDNDPKTKWSTGGSQKKGDQISFNFDRSVDLIRIVLAVDDAKADFPRGIKVVAIDSEKNEIEILNQPDWQGPIKWTTKGLSYFGGQGDVTIELPMQIKTSGIKVIQTSSSSTFDWSISQAKFFRLNK